MLVHRSALDVHDHVNALHTLRDQTGLYLYPVHRLDKPTSGVLLFACTRSCARALAQQFEQHVIEKSYTAVARGYCATNGTIDHAIRDRDSKSRIAQSAVTGYQTLALMEIPESVDRYPTSRYSLISLSPITGRRHQIRQHMKHINHPLIGDSSYGKAIHNRFFSQRYNSHRLLLHADKLTLKHPQSGKTCSITAPVIDEQFKRVIDDPLWTRQSLSSQDT